MSSSKRSTIIVEHLRRQQMWDFISKGKRLDGRNLDEMRPLEIELDIIKKANGSAKVKLGNSEVVAGIKVETGEQRSVNNFCRGTSYCVSFYRARTTG